jgi:hypothetical protein
MHIDPAGKKIKKVARASLLPGGSGRFFSNRFIVVNSCPATDYCAARWRSNCGYAPTQHDFHEPGVVKAPGNALFYECRKETTLPVPVPGKRWPSLVTAIEAVRKCPH